MSAIYMIDGKPHELCTCSNLTDACQRGAKRPMQTAGYGQCLIPCEGIVVAVGEPAPASLSEFVHAPDSVRERIGESVIDGAIKAQNAKIAAPASGGETPRTDKEAFTAMGVGAEGDPTYNEFEAVEAEFARQLERELSQANAAREGAMLGVWKRIDALPGGGIILTPPGTKEYCKIDGIYYELVIPPVKAE